MPLSSICTVTRPNVSRNAGTRDVTMTSQPMHQYRDITAYYSPTLSRRLINYSYELPKSPKKEKKWSFGSLFRRKKRDDSSSSEDDAKKHGFLNRRNNKKTKKPKLTFDHVVFNHRTNGDDAAVFSDPAHDNATNNKKSRRGLAKFRAEIRRITLRDSSSDEDSQLSAPPSIVATNNRRSRAARTERYMKRHSRDGENPRDYLRLSKSDADRSPSRSPLQPMMGVSTIPPSHTSYKRVSNSTSNPSYKPPQSINDYNRRLGGERSVSYDADIHRTNPIYMNEPRAPPPPPPPRDPKRLNPHHDSPRPNTYYFDTRSKSFNLQGRSTSEDYLVGMPVSRRLTMSPEVLKRPENYNYLTDKKPRSRKPILIQNQQQKAMDFWKEKEAVVKPQIFNCQTQVKTQLFLPTAKDEVDFNDIERTSLSPPSPFKTPPVNDRMSPISARLTLQFVSDEKRKQKNDDVAKKSREGSQNYVKPPVLKRQSNSGCNQPVYSENKRSDVRKSVPNQPQQKPMNRPQTMLTNQNTQTSNRIASPTNQTSNNIATPIAAEQKRRSTNLEDALDELEAIYNSLRLGDDENLLERAEQREQEIQEQRVKDHQMSMSDSGFAYEPFDSCRRKRRKSQTLERIRRDDMALRKLHKERSQTINDPLAVLSNVSYLLASPLHNAHFDGAPAQRPKTSEPDVTTDDVVYRNVKYAITGNPKVHEPQPPFGIPLGPITPSSNSDYLHLRPVGCQKPSKHPDPVIDDLAYRNLRKDRAALPPQNKKKRAVRSLSANIGSIMNKDEEFRTLTDIADAMEIARQVLKEKEQKISATRRAFMSDTETVDESRMNFLNGMRNEEVRKVPKARERRSKTTANQRDSLVDLLTSLATEARETSERIDREFVNKGEKMEDIESVSEQARKCEVRLDKVLKGVTGETPKVGVDQLTQKAVHKILEGVDGIKEVVQGSFDELKKVARVVNNRPIGEFGDSVLADKGIKDDGKSDADVKNEDIVVTTSETSLESVHNDLNHLEGVVNNEIKLLEDLPRESDTPLKAPLAEADQSDHDYVNVQSDTEVSKSPFEEHRDSLIATFRELAHSSSSGESREDGRVATNKPMAYSQLESPKLVLEVTDRSMRRSARDAERKCDWYQDPAVLAVACSYGCACVQLLMGHDDVVTVLGLLFALMSFIAALIS